MPPLVVAAALLPLAGAEIPADVNSDRLGDLTAVLCAVCAAVALAAFVSSAFVAVVRSYAAFPVLILLLFAVYALLDFVIDSTDPVGACIPFFLISRSLLPHLTRFSLCSR